MKLVVVLAMSCYLALGVLASPQNGPAAGKAASQQTTPQGVVAVDDDVGINNAEVRRTPSKSAVRKRQLPASWRYSEDKNSSTNTMAPMEKRKMPERPWSYEVAEPIDVITVSQGEETLPGTNTTAAKDGEAERKKVRPIVYQVEDAPIDVITLSQGRETPTATTTVAIQEEKVEKETQRPWVYKVEAAPIDVITSSQGRETPTATTTVAVKEEKVEKETQRPWVYKVEAAPIDVITSSQGRETPTETGTTAVKEEKVEKETQRPWVYKVETEPIDVITSSQEPMQPQHGKVVTCYMASSARYRRGRGRFRIEDLHPEHCTHLIYAFAGVDDYSFSIQSLDPLADLEDDDGLGWYKRITGLRQQYPGLKILLSIGGEGVSSRMFANVAKSSEGRSTFAVNAVEFLEEYGFDGLDLIWWYPGEPGTGTRGGKESFVDMIKELSEAFKDRGLLLTAAVGPMLSTIDTSFNIPELSKYLDFIHVWAFGYHDDWPGTVQANAPLYSKFKHSVDDTVRYLLALGAPAGKLILGLSMYGYNSDLKLERRPSQGNPIGEKILNSGFRRPYLEDYGFITYNEICTELTKGSDRWNTGWDDNSSTPYAVLDDIAIVYENPRSIALKVDYAKNMSLGGVMVWSIDMDDFRGDYADLHKDFLNPLTGFDYPMMRAINLALSKNNQEYESVRPQDAKVVTCYVDSWATYRINRLVKFHIEDLRPELCTHLVYAFADLDASTSTIRSLRPRVDLEDNHGFGSYKKITGLRRQYPGLKVSLAIGGWEKGSGDYSELAASPERRRTFVASVVQFLKMYDFDGFDLVWMYPGKRGGAPEDKENFVQLVKELSEAFKSGGLLLTAGIAADKDTIDTAYDIPELSKYLDFIHVWAFDYPDQEGNIAINAPLRRADNNSVEGSIRHLLALGAPPEKLVLGLPLYGYINLLYPWDTDSRKHPIGAPIPKTEYYPFIENGGLMAYNQICEYLLNNTDKSLKLVWDDESSTPYAIMRDIVHVYDNPRSVAVKTDFANQMNLGGVMVWSIDMDDIHGDCANLHNDFLNSTTGFDFPLMRVINLALGRSIDDHKNHTVIESNISNSTSGNSVVESVTNTSLIRNIIENQTNSP